MTTTLEKPKTNSSAATRPASSGPQTAPPPVKQVIGAGSAHRQESAHQVEVGVKQGTGLLSKSVRALKHGAFQLGFTAPSRLWYRELPRLNAKEKVLLDAQLHGIF